ncbi:unnamed protein product [Protopolystoma xenopodis]|uniref:Uncharacterized protein n=1 Tax=Protopolystoma xenopodis TaxID=117903 RepID=A0A448XL73_9PLAT|nr:unnamed protein product [Protopolystoma xenopodis]
MLGIMTTTLADDFGIGAFYVNDRAYTEEVEQFRGHMTDSESACDEIAISLAEPLYLPLPLFIPEDGYACDTSTGQSSRPPADTGLPASSASARQLRGIPSGLIDFLQPLVEKGIIQIYRNDDEEGAENEATRSRRVQEEESSKPGRSWTGHLIYKEVDSRLANRLTNNWADSPIE